MLGTEVDGAGAIEVAVTLVPIAEPAATPAPELADLLDEDERARAARFRRPADGARFAIAHAALRVAVAERTGLAARDLRFASAPCPLCGELHGRPVLVGGGLELSLTHADGLVAVALSPAGVAVGIDAEPLGRSVGAADVLHPREVGADPLLTWVRKEAYLKGTGTGLGVEPHTVDLSSGEPPGWSIVDVASPTHVVAVAVAAQRSVVTVHTSAAAGSGE